MFEAVLTLCVQVFTLRWFNCLLLAENGFEGSAEAIFQSFYKVAMLGSEAGARTTWMVRKKTV